MVLYNKPHKLVERMYKFLTYATYFRREVFLKQLIMQ